MMASIVPIPYIRSAATRSAPNDKIPYAGGPRRRHNARTATISEQAPVDGVAGSALYDALGDDENHDFRS
jgi:hypothetical protein